MSSLTNERLAINHEYEGGEVAES